MPTFRSFAFAIPFLYLAFFAGCSRRLPVGDGLPVWQSQALNRSASIRGLSAVNEQVAWLSGSENTVARTTDGGRSWQLLPAPGEDTLDFRDIQAFDSLRAVLMSAGPGRRSRIYRTEDGGQSWQLSLQNEAAQGFFNGIAFWNDREGLLTGDPIDGALYIALTHDGGRSWERVPATLIPPVDSLEYGFAASGTHIAVQQEGMAWIGTGGSRARVFRSTDGGRHWNATMTPIISGRPSAGIFSLAFTGKRRGIAVGGDYARDTLSGGNIAISADGGHRWKPVQGRLLSYRSCIAYAEGWLLAAGTPGTDLSFDGGKSWHSLGTTAYHVISTGGSRQAVWAAGPEGRVAKLMPREQGK